MILGKDLKSVEIFVEMILFSTFLAWLYSLLCQKRHLPVVIRFASYFIITYPFVSVIGNRYLTVGADTKNYVKQLMNSIDYGELSYKFVSNIIRSLDGTYTTLFWIYAMITLVGLVAVVDMIERDVNLPTFLFLFFTFFGLNMADQMRQIAALPYLLCTICLFAKRKIKCGILIGCLSIILHTSSLFSIMIWFLVMVFKERKIWYWEIAKHKIEIKPKLWILIITWIGVVFIGYEYIFSLAKTIVPLRYIQYFTTRVGKQQIGFGWLFDLLPVVCLAVEIKKKKDKKPERLLSSYALLAIPLRLFGYISQFMHRLSYIHVLMAIYLLCNQNRSKVITRKVQVLFGIIYFFVYYVYLDLHEVFPYISVLDH